MARVLKDGLLWDAGISTLVLDMDVFDPSFISIEEMQEKLESFLGKLEIQRYNRISNQPTSIRLINRQ